MINTIWVVNHSGHNIEEAVRDFRPRHVQYLTEGNQDLTALDRLKYNMYQMFSGSNPDGVKFDHTADALLLCGSTVLSVIATALLVTEAAEFKVPFLRLLIWDGKRRFYYLKDLDMGGLHKLTQDQLNHIR